MLVNAAGPWVGIVSETVLRIEGQPPVRLAKGSHIVVRKLFDHDRGYIFQNTDKRIVFALPFAEDFTLIGTTDLNFVGALDAVAPSGDEVLYLCRAVNEYFREPVGPEHVVWAFAGVRALYDTSKGKDKPEDVTRDYHLDLDEQFGAAPVLTVYGGKITTYRRLAEDALGKLSHFFQLHRRWTATTPLPGGEFLWDAIETRVAQTLRAWPFLDRGRGVAARPRLWHAGRPRPGRRQAARGHRAVLRPAQRGRGALSDAARMGAAAGRRAVAANEARVEGQQGREGSAGAVHGRRTCRQSCVNPRRTAILYSDF